MPLFGQLAEVTHIIAALLHFAAAVAAFANPPAGQTPVVVLVCEALALTLHDQMAPRYVLSWLTVFFSELMRKGGSSSQAVHI